MPETDTFNHADQVAVDVTAAALRSTLIDALAGLADGDRDVFLLIVQEELTYEQVAAALDSGRFAPACTAPAPTSVPRSAAAIP